MSDCCPVNQANTSAAPVMVCPVSNWKSKKVDLLTVRSLVRQLPLGMPQSAYYFCEDPECDVVYFPSNPKASLFLRKDLLVRVWAKERDDSVPVCYCFGFTRQDLWNEMRRKGRSTVAERIMAEVKAGNCACEVKNPRGKCCLGDVAQIGKDFVADRSSDKRF